MLKCIFVGALCYIAGGIVTIIIMCHAMAASQADDAAEKQMKKERDHEK